LRRLQQRFADELVVVGVHAPKFPAERELAHLRAAVRQLGIEHPVVQDADFEVWRSYAVRAWPTIALIDPEGRVVGTAAGEIDAERVAAVLESLIRQHAERGTLRREARAATPEPGRARTLSSPSKLLVTSESTLFVADTGNHRVLRLELDPGHKSARIAAQHGAGEPGFQDGASDVARFRAPRGMARRGSSLYVADTENHAVRAIDLESGAVRTVAGTGEIGRGPLRASGDPRAIALRSPWGLWVDRPRLFVALAGSHQIAEIQDGGALACGFNQPSDLTGAEGALFVADPEASAIRRVRLVGRPEVETLVGAGLFEWGDVDGTGPEVRLQHASGLAFDGLLFIADTYNHRVKHMDPGTRRVARLAGSGEAGHLDGRFSSARFFLPEGVTVRGRHLFVADTGNHVVRVCDLGSRTVWTLAIAD
jgi:hypothetical protein